LPDYGSFSIGLLSFRWEYRVLLILDHTEDLPLTIDFLLASQAKSI